MSKTSIVKTGDSIIPGKHNGKNILWDARFLPNDMKKPIILFVHGFKGFKDWGHFNLMADKFAQEGFVFVKMNLSHNGTTPDHPVDFVDLEAFGHNNFSIEMDDLGSLIDHIFSPAFEVPAQEINLSRLFIIGHSRGGGLAILKAYEDKRIYGLATLAAIDDLEKRWSGQALKQWEEAGVQMVHNGRTRQDMPLYFQLVEDFRRNKSRLDIPAAVKGMSKPMLIIHGNDDETLPVSMARNMKDWNSKVILEIVNGANHTFGGSHPCPSAKLPDHTRLAVEKIKNFFTVY